VKPRALGMSDLGFSRAVREGRPPPEVLDAYAQCARVTRKSGSSFASAFWMLPRPKRRALHAIYAFCRLADDIADDPAVGGDRTRLLARWRAELESAYRGKSEHPVGIALADAIRCFQLPEREFVDLLRGVESDLRGEVMESWEDLERYCYRVASTVGLLVVRVLGYRNPRSLEYARSLGVAVQLTNVLRDVGEDAAAGRIYLASEDLERLGVAAEDLRARRMTHEVRRLFEFYAERARAYYERAARALPDEDRRALRPAEAMGRIYRALLQELQRRDFPCLRESLRLSRRRRLAIATFTWLGFGGGA
jgi:phytoene synthase